MYRRTTVPRIVVLALLALTTACRPGAPPSEVSPTSQASSASRQQLDIRRVDLRSFTYPSGACGYVSVRTPVRFEDGKQISEPVEFPPYPPVEAEITRVDYVRLGGSEYALVNMQCTIGSDGMQAVHVVGAVGGRARDLGVAFRSYPLEPALAPKVKNGLLVAEEVYLRRGDANCCASGHYTARVAIVNGALQRLPSADAKPIPVKAGAGQGHPSGIVTAAYPSTRFGREYAAGVLIDRRRVAVHFRPPGLDGTCLPPIEVYTSEGETIAVKSMTVNSSSSNSPFILTLAKPHPATPLPIATKPAKIGDRVFVWPTNGPTPKTGTIVGDQHKRTGPDFWGVRAPGVLSDDMLPLAADLVATDSQGRAVALVGQTRPLPGTTNDWAITPLQPAKRLAKQPATYSSKCSSGAG